jgi:hypothetical protein
MINKEYNQRKNRRKTVILSALIGFVLRVSKNHFLGLKRIPFGEALE